MSSRQTGYRYGLDNRVPDPMSHGGGTSILDLITGNTPRKLQEQSFKHDTELAKIYQEFQKEQINLENKLKNDYANSEVGRKLLESKGITPGSPAEKAFIDSQLPRIMQEGRIAASGRTLQENALNPDKNPTIQQSANQAANIAQTISAGIKPEQLTPSANAGQVATGVNVPGMPLIQAQGATQTSTPFPAKMMPDPNNPGQMIPYEQGLATRTTPGTIRIPATEQDKNIDSGAGNTMVNPMNPSPDESGDPLSGLGNYLKSNGSGFAPSMGNSPAINVGNPMPTPIQLTAPIDPQNPRGVGDAQNPADFMNLLLQMLLSKGVQGIPGQ